MASTNKPAYSFLLILINFFPLVYLASGIGYGIQMWGNWWWWSVGLIAWLYLIPPVLCRIILLFSPYPKGRLKVSDSLYTVWWLLLQLQIVYNRLPFLEELLRFVPGLYSLWLNLWGSKVHVMAFWSPGVRLTDRYLLEVGKQAVIGTQAQLAGHLLHKDENGDMILTVATVIVGAGAIVGGHAKLGPGSKIWPGEVFPATMLLAPFNHFKDGKRSSTPKP